jgi:hypothetical protein
VYIAENCRIISEANLWWLERIVRWEVNVHHEDPSRVRTITRSANDEHKLAPARTQSEHQTSYKAMKYLSKSKKCRRLHIIAYDVHLIPGQKQSRIPRRCPTPPLPSWTNRNAPHNRCLPMKQIILRYRSCTVRFCLSFARAINGAPP